jgi:acetyltransferase-like isoleucine patch superfamily enzyme
LKIGENCYIGDCVYFDLADQVIIGNNVVVSGYAAFVTHADCNRSKYLENIFPRICKSITIQDGAWVAFRATILTGVTVQKNSVVAAHSLVSADVEECTMVAGAPARKIRNLGEDHAPHP